MTYLPDEGNRIVRVYYRDWSNGEFSLAATTEVPEATDDLDACEQLFSAFNRHDADDQSPLLDANGLRSMSVGDVITLERGSYLQSSYRCDTVGFVPCATPRLS